MGARLSGVANALYNPKRKEFLGRDGARWAKLGIFYFFFYVGLAGFFCAMLAVFMALTPRDQPRYSSGESSMQTRSNPFSPGLGFRPQPDVDKNLVYVEKDAPEDTKNPYVTNLNQYLRVYYPQGGDDVSANDRKFTISNPLGCTSDNKYGFIDGKPCVLVKMNKIVNFVPQPGYRPEDATAYASAKCPNNSNAIAVHCRGEYPADDDNIGSLTYISENGNDDKCGVLDTKWFPYEGKSGRKDVYQAPYIWVQFNNPTPNVLINVICRVFAQNIYFDRKTSRALTRLQIYVQDTSEDSSNKRDDDV